MKKRGLKILSFALAALLLLPILTGCTGGDTPAKGGVEKFSWWLYQGEDSSYYPNYGENPGIKYMLTKAYGPENKQLDLEFMQPVTGSEQDNFNTLLSTGEYADIMAMSAYTGSVVDLYEQGIVLDLTEYVDKYMPNYKSFMEANPSLKMYAVNIVNGERKYLQLWGLGDEAADTWCGYQYRRDWIIKYGVNPHDGSAFSGSYTETLSDGSVDTTSWVDNVIFPSGGSDPVYISDWEWMLEIFARAIEDLGIKDGYPMSIAYTGMENMGGLASSFGGGNISWYKNADDQIAFGGTSEEFRAYTQCLNTWFENGWIDKAFAEHSADMPYRIDDAKVRSGKVGLWVGIQAQLIGKLDDGEDLRAGMVSFAARTPINDKYGTEAQQGKEPYAMYQIARMNSSITITNKAKEKDLATLFSFLDSLYGGENSLVCSLGLNKAQYEATKDDFYTRHGLTEGAYTTTESENDETYLLVEAVRFDTGNLINACRALRLNTFMYPNSKIPLQGSPTWLHNLDEWVAFESTGFLQPTFTSMLSPDDSKVYSKTNTQVNEFMAKNLPQFIRGEKDPYDDAAWNAFTNALGKYRPEKVTEIFQTLLSTLME